MAIRNLLEEDLNSVQRAVADRPRLFVICTSFPSLSETFIVDHIIGMARAGWRITVVACQCDQKMSERLQAQEAVNFELVELPDWRKAPGLGRLRTVLQTAGLVVTKIPSHVFNRIAWRCARLAVDLMRLIETRDPSVIHAHFGPNGVAAALASDLPLLVNFHGFDFTSWVKRWGWRLYRSTLARAVIVAHSAFAEERLKENGIRNVTRVTMGVDMARFHPPERGQKWRRPLRLLSVGRLVSQKGHDVALRVTAILRVSRPELDVRLRIVGAGAEHANLERLADNLALREVLEGPTAVGNGEMPGVYEGADVLIVASQTTPDGWEEAFCRVAAEGMACGLPVVATPCGGLADTVGSGGIVAGAQDAPALAAAVETLIAAGGPAHWAARSRASANRFRIDRMREEYSTCTSTLL